MEQSRVMARISVGRLALFPSRTMSAQHIRNTSPIRSIQGNPGKRNFMPKEKTNEPNAATNAPFAVARL